MKKSFLFILVMTVLSCVSFGQTTKARLDPIKTDPKSTENAAKADGQVINKKNVIDPVAFKNISVKRKEKEKAKRRKSLQRRSS